MPAGNARRNDLEAIPERRPEELELGACIYCKEDVDPKGAAVFWPFSVVNAVAHPTCFLEAEDARRARAECPCGEGKNPLHVFVCAGRSS